MFYGKKWQDPGMPILILVQYRYCFGARGFRKRWRSRVDGVLNQDIVIIVLVVIFFFVDRFIHARISRMPKYNVILENIVFNVICYLVLVGVSLLYMWILNLFAPVQIYSWAEFFLYNLVGYVIVAAILNIKHYVKSKQSPNLALPVQ